MKQMNFRYTIVGSDVNAKVAKPGETADIFVVATAGNVADEYLLRHLGVPRGRPMPEGVTRAEEGIVHVAPVPQRAVMQ